MGLTEGDPELLAVADQLYAGDPSGFVAARDAAAREARAAGNRRLATAVKALRRPTLGAWYVNVAARARLTALMEWLALGRDLREAQERWDAASLRQLGARRAPLERRVVADLTAHLAAVGVTAGPAALDEVRETLRAALADADAAAAVSAGRLDRPLHYAGFGEVDLGAALAAMAGRTPAGESADSGEPPAGEAADGGAADGGAAEDQARAAAAHEARRAASLQRLERARAEAAAAAEALSDRRAAEEEARDRVRRLTDDLAAARRTLERRSRETLEASRAAEDAGRAVTEAARAVEGPVPGL